MRIFAIAIYLAVLCASPATQPPRYSVIPLGTPASAVEGTAHFLQPSRINNKGDVIGVGTQGPFLYRDGVVRYLWSASEPLYAVHLADINDRGVILGVAYLVDELGPVIRYTYPTAGRGDFNLSRAQPLPVPSQFYPGAINDKGMLAGHVPFGKESRAAVYHHGELHVLPSLVPGAHATAWAINNRGQVIGTAYSEVYVNKGPPLRAVIWTDGRIQDLGLLPGTLNAQGAHINDHGEAVGICHDGYSFFAPFIYRNGVMTQIPVPPRTLWADPTRIDNAGDVLIGYYPRPHPDPDVLADGTWLYSNGILHDLDQMISDATGWSLTSTALYDINDRGEIVGMAQYLRDNILYAQGILLLPSR